MLPIALEEARAAQAALLSQADQPPGHAEQIGLRAVAVGHHPALDVLRTAGDVGQTRGDEAARARLRDGQRLPARGEGFDDGIGLEGGARFFGNR